MTILFVLLAIVCMGVRASAAEGGFLFSTFRDETTPMSEQIYMGISQDGRHWDELNGGNPVLVSDVGEKGVRDSFLLRSHDGHKVWLIATDLCIARNSDWTRAKHHGSRSLVIWESSDLVDWTKPRLAVVAPDDAGCAWAPEAIYDGEAGNYLVFWASTTGRDDYAKHRIWAARTTDFRSFSEPFPYIDKPTNVIDTTIVRDGANYYRFSKDEQFKAITLETADRLTGPWRDVPEFSLAHLVGYEGPACYVVEPGRDGRPPVWGLILDHYAKSRGYQPFVTRDLAGGQFSPAVGFSFPYKFRHGSVLPLTAGEYARLASAFLSAP